MTSQITRRPSWRAARGSSISVSAMVNFCAVYGCSNRGDRDKKSFFRLPTVITNQCDKTRELSERRRLQWLSNLGRDFKSTNLSNIRVCSDHFVKGELKYTVLLSSIALLDLSCS